MAIATADFMINGKADYGEEFKNVPVHLELNKSGAFAYGNQTCVTMAIEGHRTEYFDTRYDGELRRDGSNFKEWALNLMQHYLSDGLVVTEA